MKEKRRVFSWDVLRAICPMIIIAFHYSCTVDGESWRPLYTYANGNWGSLCVSVFFMLSGASLYSSHQGRDKIDSLQFYKKRFFSLFPMFYTVWIIMYIINALEKEKLFFAGSPVSILLSLIGMDGYFSYLGPNYFLNVGEWFLGALVWCYLFFPIMFKIAKKNYGGGVIVSASLEVVCLSIGFFKISTFRNLATCFMSFYIGIGISRYYDKIKCSMKNLWLVLLFDLLFLIKVPTAISSPYIMQCMGIAIILFLIAIEDFLEKQYYIKRQIITISKLSYPIFLLQHIIINVILSHTQERGAHILALIYACIIVCAWILFTLTNKLEKLIKEKNSTDC